MASTETYALGTTMGMETHEKRLRVAPALLFVTFLFSSSPAQVAMEWIYRYNGTADSVDVARFIALDPSRNICVAGHSWDWNGEYDLLTMKFTPSGDTLWKRLYNGPGNFWDVPRGMVLDAAGNVYVTGWSMGSGSWWDYVTIKYNSSGIQQWAARYNGPANYWDWATAIAVDNMGNVYVTGQSSATWGQMDFDFATIKYSPEGDTLWVRRYNGVGNFSDVARAIAVDDSGNVYVTGSSAENSQPPYMTRFKTIKYNSLGDVVWMADYFYQLGDGGTPLAISLDHAGNVYVTGVSYSFASGGDFATIKYNASGVEQWVRRYNGPTNGYDQPWAMAVDSSGNVFVVGYYGFGDRGVVIKYSTEGVEEWVAHTSVTGVGEFDMTIDDFGNIYITGKCNTPQTYDDIVTIKYDPSGVEQWVRQYNGTGNHHEYSNAIVVDGTGNVYIAGESIGQGTDYDAVVIKYIQAPHVRLVSPEHGATVNADTVQCVWRANTPAVTHYWFERATDSLFITNLLTDSTLADTTLVTRNLVPNTTYWWRVRAKNAAGWGPFSQARNFIAAITDVVQGTPVRREFRLLQNYPNPFNPITNIQFSIPNGQFAMLKVYNVLGQEVVTLVNEVRQPGTYSIQFDASNLPSGVYFYRLQAGWFSETRKLLLMR